jgi:hypothetical protein
MKDYEYGIVGSPLSAFHEWTRHKARDPKCNGKECLALSLVDFHASSYLFLHVVLKAKYATET